MLFNVDELYFCTSNKLDRNGQLPFSREFKETHTNVLNVLRVPRDCQYLLHLVRGS